MEKRKSVAAFVLGLVSSLCCLGWGFVFAVAGGLVSLVINEISIIKILGWLCFFGGILGIVGASQCFKKARVGGIMLSIATVMCGTLLIYVFVSSINSADVMIGTQFIVDLLPVGLFVAADICAFIAKPVLVNNGYNGQMQQPQQSALVQQGKTMEEKLTDLKSMFEKQLITQDEYNTAKKNIIKKHTEN